jgi:hypothetical protein
MNLKPLAANKTEVTITNKEGNRVRVLFSYKTPVAFDVLSSCGLAWYRTATNYSRTSERHINSWLPKDQVIVLTQAEFDDALDGLI